MVFAATRDRGFISDFDQIWLAGRALMAGADPYRAVVEGFGGFGPLPFPLFYPLPAVVAGVPFALLPLVAARALFAGLSIGTFAYLLSGRGMGALAALLSAPAFLTVSLVQWSGWLACAAIIPWFGWVVACKPNVGIAVLTGTESNRSFIVSLSMVGVLVLAAFALQPSWVTEWVEALRGQPHFRPYVLRPGGVLMLLALLRWRRPEARWLAAIACLPGTPGPQEALVFFAWPVAFRSVLILGLLSHAAMWAAFPARQTGDFYSYVNVAGMANLIFLYGPMLILVLRRPNEGPIPRVLDRGVRAVADRLRGIVSTRGQS